MSTKLLNLKADSRRESAQEAIPDPNRWNFSNSLRLLSFDSMDSGAVAIALINPQLKGHTANLFELFHQECSAVATFLVMCIVPRPTEAKRNSDGSSRLSSTPPPWIHPHSHPRPHS